MIDALKQHTRAFGLYTSIFFGVVLYQRYFLFDAMISCKTVHSPFFFESNYLRGLFLVLPFLYFSCPDKKLGILKNLRQHTPFLLIGCAALARHEYQIVYLALSILSSIILKSTKWVIFVLSGILLFLFIPDLVIHRECARLSSVKVNMSTFQTLLESYALTHEGHYPDNVLTLKSTAQTEHYWKDFTNPFTHEMGYQKSYSDLSPQVLNEIQAKNTNRLFNLKKLDLLGIRLMEDTRHYALQGQVLYHRISEKQYRIYGTSNQDTHLIYYQGKPLVLSSHP